MSEDEHEHIIPYFFQRAVDTGAHHAHAAQGGCADSPRHDSQIRLDCLWLIAQAYRAYTGCAAPAWQAILAGYYLAASGTFPARAGMNRTKPQLNIRRG